VHETWALLEATASRLASLRELPAAIMWGMDDRTLPAPALAELRAALPRAEVHELDGVGHLVPELASEAVREAIHAVHGAGAVR
jgi:pimeloyl-ACP methyl ester carboxylesterase